VFDKVQEERAQRERLVYKEDGTVESSANKYSGKYILGNLLVCGDCSASYRRRTERGKAVWSVRRELKKEKRRAPTPPLWMKSGLKMFLVDWFAKMRL
jgi:site-specific DNA recombinase